MTLKLHVICDERECPYTKKTLYFDKSTLEDVNSRVSLG